MNLEQLIEGVKNETIEIDFQGHHVSWLVQRLEQQLKFRREMVVNVANDKDINDNRIEYYKERAEGELLKIDTLFELNCSHCDRPVYLVRDGEGFYVLDFDTYFGDIKIPYKDQKQADLENGKIVARCTADEINKKGMLVSEIDVPTGKLIFQNYFKADKLYKVMDEGYHSINSIIGRNHLMQSLAKHNCGYGQMGNMSVNIWAKDGGDTIIVGDDMDSIEDSEHYYSQKKNQKGEYYEEWLKGKPEEEEFIKSIEGLEDLGSISLSVWRWQCIDKRFYDEHNEELDDHLDQVIVNVKPGRYRIEHYYDFPGHEHLYSKLNWISEINS